MFENWSNTKIVTAICIIIALALLAAVFVGNHNPAAPHRPTQAQCDSTPALAACNP